MLLMIDNYDSFTYNLVQYFAELGAEVEMGDIDLHEYYKLMGLKELLKYALIVVAAFPILVVYPFVQKYFIKGMMIGSVK